VVVVVHMLHVEAEGILLQQFQVSEMMVEEEMILVVILGILEEEEVLEVLEPLLLVQVLEVLEVLGNLHLFQEF